MDTAPKFISFFYTGTHSEIFRHKDFLDIGIERASISAAQFHLFPD